MMMMSEGKVVNDRANVGGHSQVRRRDRRSNGADSVNDDANGGGSGETVAVVDDEKSIEQAMYDLFIQQLAEDFGINHGSSINSYSGDDEGDEEDDDGVDVEDDEEEDAKMNALKKLSILPARRLVIAPTVVTTSCVVEFILNNRLTIGNDGWMDG